MTNIFSTANEIVGKLKTGDISCVDLCKAYIDRIEKFEKDVKAWAFFDKKLLLEKAEEKDEYRKSGKPLGPLHGLPIGIKDIIGTYDMPTECGTVLRKGVSESSDVQRRQMTTPSESNVHAIAINGHFDDCQARLKDMFNDFEFRDGVNLAGVNSINWARVLAQVVYYFSSAVKLGAPNKKISFSVPTGNFGDIFAGFIAKKMGLSIDRLVIATNQNDILHRCLSSGVYKTDKVLPSISPSMDIQVSSNFERALFYATECNGSEVSNLMEQLKSTGQFTVSGSILEILRENFDSGRASEDETHSEIAYNYQKHSELLCPHSAIGVLTARKQRKIDTPMVTLATAHPAKFPTAVKNATSVFPELPSRMANLFDLDERITNVENNLQSIQAFVKERI